MLKVESFTASTAQPRTVQLGGGGASTITEALDPYGGTLPLLMQPAVAEATCHNRESLPLQRCTIITTAALTTPYKQDYRELQTAAGRSPRQQGGAHGSSA